MSEAVEIKAVDVTPDCLTDRAGLTLFARYVQKNVPLLSVVVRLFGALRKSKKGLAVVELFKQLLCFFMDGTSHRLTRFDELAKDEGYAAAIGTAPSDMASSHQVKRWFNGFSFVRNFLFRKVLQWIFIWRLKIRQPSAIVLNLDTMVMDNDDAERREGVQPTYKKVKGFQPLQMTWESFIIDAVFRGGKKHSNHGKTVIEMVRHIVALIRKHYRADVPIVLRTDGGFFDKKNFTEFEGLGMGYICGGKLYQDIGEFVTQCPKTMWEVHQNGDQQWETLEFGDRRGNWKRFRRALFCRPLAEDGQCLFEFARPDTVLYTNLGMGAPVDVALVEAGMGRWLRSEGLLTLAHGRGSDELVHRGLKDFGTQHLPFKRFAPNTAFYYTMVIAFNLFEAFKQDVLEGVALASSYASTVRRTVLDTAGKVVRTGGQAILKVTQATWDRLGFDALWERANTVLLPDSS